MTRIFLIRHAQPLSDWGEHADPGLSETGRAQADAMAAALAAIGTFPVISSPMARCLETAAPYLARVGGGLTIEPRVGEVPTPPGIRDRRAWLGDNFPWAPGAPRRAWGSVDSALLRWRDTVLAGIRDIDGDCAVFTHFIATNAILGAAMGSAKTIVHRPNFASITEIGCDDGALRIVKLGAEMSAGEVR